MVNEAQTTSTGKDKPAPKVAPEVPRDDSGHQEAEREDERKIPAMLPSDDLALAQITDVRDPELAAGLHEHPADVRPPEALVRVVRVELRVGVAVVRTVST